MVCRCASDSAFDQCVSTSLSTQLLPDVDSATCLDLQALDVQETRKMKDDTKIHHIVDDLISRPRKLVGNGQFCKTVNSHSVDRIVFVVISFFAFLSCVCLIDLFVCAHYELCEAPKHFFKGNVGHC